MNLRAFSSSPQRAGSEREWDPTPTTPHHAGNRRDGDSPFRFKSKPFLVTPMRQTRILAVLGIFLGWTVLIAGRLLWLQVIQHTEWAERAERQQERTFTVAPRRGILYDRNLHELAMTVVADSIYAVPSEIGANKEKTAEALARVVHTDPEDRFTGEKQILARLMDSRNFAWVARKQTPAVIDRVQAMKLKGIYVQKEFKRFYPDRHLAAQVLGYVGMDDDGLAGVEEDRDRDLHGTPGRMLTAIDARRHVLDSEERDPEPGANLVLTIDANIQFMAEQALDRNMERTGALNGTVVVQDPHTGQILALAIRPTFDPNNFRHTDPSLLKDHAVSDVYEPGSTFKLVTYSAALDQGVTTPDATIRTLGGQINVAGRIVHDDRDAILYEAQHSNVLTTTQALEESSDVAAIELAQKMGPDRFYQYIHGYGFGLRSGIELPGETRGLVKPPARWQPTTIGSIPMGQEIAVTPIQLVSMASSIANGGVYLPPHIVLESTPEMKGSANLKATTFRPEDELPNPLPVGAHRVISEMTSAQMRKMMEGVVLFGTGRPAQLDGYSAGGKTGTAQKIDPNTHTYSKTKYVASFVGFAPVNNPAITIAVIMDSPSKGSYFGTAASAPVFHDLAQQILEYLGVPHDQDLKPEEALARDSKPAQPETAPQENAEALESLFAEVNHLPADDPLRNPSPDSTGLRAQGSEPSGPEPGIGTSQQDVDNPAAQHPAPTLTQAAPPAASTPVPAPKARNGSVAVLNRSIAVPSFLGKSLRDVVVQASGIGLGIQIVGSGLAREQAPAAGTLVPAGTEIVVRFAQ
ncbi:MAG: penicillin-binding transpeptidase domain-containing protein [Acidobacteriaceae bacterium]